MAFNRRGRDPTNTTPHLSRKMSASYWWSIIKTGLIFGLPLAALLTYGQPALLIKYGHTGPRSDPYMTRCLYRSVAQWHDVTPAYGRCPYLTTFPINIHNILGE